MRLHICSIALLLIAVTATAAPMSRVVAVVDSQTIAIDTQGVPATIRLAGIEVTDRRNALALLTWALKDSWVLIDEGLVYRSPDGLLVNLELVRRGFARSTAPQTTVLETHRGVYLGEAAPGSAPRTTARAKEVSTPPSRAKPVMRTTRRLPRLIPKPRKRPAG